MEEVRFQAECDNIGGLINHRRFDEALPLAEALAQTAPGRAQSYFFLNLAVCLTGKTGGAWFRSPHIVDRARQCKDATNELIGDMLRDQAIALIRNPLVDGLTAAGRVIDEIRALHAGDRNRLACIMGIEERWLYAQGETCLALRLGRDADGKFCDLGAGRNVVWHYNLLVHNLKSVVSCEGPWSLRARELTWRIRYACPEGMKNRKWEARIIRIPLVGNFIDDWLRRR